MKAASLLLLACAAAPLAQAQQQEQEPESQPARYLIGVSVSSRPEYDGAASRQTRLNALWALQVGRWRLSTSGGSALLGFGRESAGPGASTQLIETARLRLGLALRVDNGRSSNDASTTRGLPDVKRTLRARLYANYSLAPDLNLGAALSQDLLGHQGGLNADVNLGWRFYRSPTLEWTSGIGFSAADAQNMRSYFGVPERAMAASGRPAYVPGSGLRDLHAGVGFTRPFARHWFVFGSAGASRLLGPAAASPLVEKRDGSYAAIGLAWRN
ncbi:MipA/OmpV family protein [Roseateles saccharophilus]|uniref:Outer membrane scaffolding protein for murein synthesis (MipA/OmpV family) n=1 Tax=Roseateles saccharophilus TaxID=304 RepID=A0A4R3VFH2_ROSSA|nr:MipA/OmpV family protein [Roseateles saccharophilus]MDG0832187.1 MipA/OmpV family protein [Roseateles saccharophilus]TCV02438.1 outer membrane scaffolding protein for murein synthesis (MipA/OmpV family) [Roseateles saccharophilus]